MLDYLKRYWHYFKMAVILHKELTLSEKKRYNTIGTGTIINKPVVLHSGQNGISIGKNTTILHSSRLQTYNTGGTQPEIIIGDDCYIGFFFTALCASTEDYKGIIRIGNRVLIASNVMITTENHGMDPESNLPYMDQKLNSNSVQIADDCWIGQNVCILPGVKIGTYSIIGAGSVVTKSIPEYCMAVGNPAKVIKKYNFNVHRWESV